MTVPLSSAAAHNPTVKVEYAELVEFRRRIEAVIELCLKSMSARPNAAGIVDTGTVWPTDVLDALGVDYGPGSTLASRPDEE